MTRISFVLAACLLVSACATEAPKLPPPVIKPMTVTQSGIAFEYRNATLEGVSALAMKHCERSGKAALLLDR